MTKRRRAREEPGQRRDVEKLREQHDDDAEPG